MQLRKWQSDDRPGLVELIRVLAADPGLPTVEGKAGAGNTASGCLTGCPLADVASGEVEVIALVRVAGCQAGKGT